MINDEKTSKEIILSSSAVGFADGVSVGAGGVNGLGGAGGAGNVGGYNSGYNAAADGNNASMAGGNAGKKGFFSSFFASGGGGGGGSGSGGSKPKGEGILRKIKNIKHIEVIIAVGAVLLMLAIYFVGLGGGGSKESGQPEVASGGDYCVNMQSELSAYVSKIKGAGKTQVIINWESSVELLLAATESNSPNSSTKTPTVINSSGGSKPIVIKEIYPKAVGVVVVCQGGADARVKVDIMMSVSTLLNLSTDKIIVLPMTK